VGKLWISEPLARAFATDGLTSIEEIGYIPLDELLKISSADRESILSARQRARQFLAPNDL
jgi:transcription termination factor NusA